MILLITNKKDLSADFVVETLRQRGAAFLRLNTEDMPDYRASIHLPGGSWNLRDGRRSVDLTGKLKSVWYRRPGRPLENVHDTPAEVQSFVAEQWRMFVSGLRAVPDILWVNDPAKNAAAEAKIVQLETACRLGLHIPQTYVGNDPDALRRFVTRCPNGVVAKALYAPLVHVSNHDYFVFTSELPHPDEISESEAWSGIWRDRSR